MKLRLDGPPWAWAGLFASILVVLVCLDFIAMPPQYYPYGDPKVYYGPAALLILNGTRCLTYHTVTPCNYEHPPLAKLLLAASIKTFGYNQLGLAILPIVFGAGSIIAVYCIARKIVGEDGAKYAAFFLAVDGTFIGMSTQMWLDTPMLFFGLAAIAVYLYDFKKWEKAVAVGSLLALSMLSKETGAMIVVVWMAMELYMKKLGTKGLLLAVASMVGVSIAGLQLYVSLFTDFNSYLAYVYFIVAHNTIMTQISWKQSAALSFLGKDITPAAWFLMYPAYQFITTMPEEWMFLGVLVGCVFLLLAKRLKDRKPLAFTSLWLAVTYLPMIAMQWLRPTYPYYMLLVLPGVVVLDGWAMTKLPRMPRAVIMILCLIWLSMFLPMTSGFGIRSP